MRVLMTTDTIGGVWTFTKELSAGLLQLGHAVSLVGLGRAPSQEQLAWASRMNEDFCGRFIFESSCAPLEWMNANDAAYADVESLLLRIADNFAPDLLHSNQFCFGRLPLDVPKMITAHSDVFSWAAACRPAGLEPSPWLAQYRSLVHLGLAGADAVIAPTHWMLNALAENDALPPANYVIPNGRDLACVSQEQPRILQAVSVGRLWDEGKNLALLYDVKAPFPIYAVGEQQYDTAAAPTDAGGINMVGSLPEEELLLLLRRSSIYLITSIYEPFGLAPLEAALCGCAVVANDIPSLREVWGDDVIYFHGADELTQILRKLQASPEMLKVARQRSHRRALTFSAGRMTEAYVQVYTNHLSSNPQRAAQELTTIAS